MHFQSIYLRKSARIYIYIFVFESFLYIHIVANLQGERWLTYVHATCEMYARERKKKGKEKLKREKSKNEKGRGDGEWKGNNLFDEYSRFN